MIAIVVGAIVTVLAPICAITSIIPGITTTTMLFETILSDHGGSDLWSFVITTNPGTPITKTKTPSPWSLKMVSNSIVVVVPGIMDVIATDGSVVVIVVGEPD